jgi:hypothetical protein
MTSSALTDQDPFASIELLSETKSRAEDRIKIAGSMVSDGDLTTRELRELRIMYSDARAQVNAGLERLVVELEATKQGATPETFEMVATRAAEQIQLFLQQSDALLDEDRAATEAAGLAKVAGPAIEGVKSIASALVDVWKTLRGEKKERRAALIKRVEGLKWAAFEELIPDSR